MCLHRRPRGLSETPSAGEDGKDHFLVEGFHTVMREGFHAGGEVKGAKGKRDNREYFISSTGRNQTAETWWGGEEGSMMGTSPK